VLLLELGSLVDVLVGVCSVLELLSVNGAAVDGLVVSNIEPETPVVAEESVIVDKLGLTGACPSEHNTYWQSGSVGPTEEPSEHVFTT